MKILVIEDDEKIVSAISFAFQLGWPDVKIVSSDWGQEGLDLVEKECPDSIILDLGLPDMDGMNIIKKIRAFSRVPILVLTVNKEEATLVQALELGANDYVIKPFRQMELLARVKRLVSRQLETDGFPPIIMGPLLFDYQRRSLKYGEKMISLRNIENEIFYTLIKNSPMVVTHSALSKAVWGDDYDGSTDCIKVHIRHLRQKLEEDPDDPQIIFTKAGVGYYLVIPK